MSSARIRLLRAAGLDFQAVPHGVDEASIARRVPLDQLATTLAQEKALSLCDAYPEDLIIGSDQVLAVDGRPCLKTTNISEVRDQLLLLRGRAHHLHTAVSCVRHRGVVFAHETTTEMVMRDFSDAFLDQYMVANGNELLGCAGGYQIEAMGIQLFKTVGDDLFSIQGIPLLPLVAFLRNYGILTA